MNDADAVTDQDRQDVAIFATADALLAVCALQTGTDPEQAMIRALDAIEQVAELAAREARGGR